MANPRTALRKGDALIFVDVQKDFCRGGALPIDGGDEVVPVLNRWIAAAIDKGLPIYASRDWHPTGHMSFKERGGIWAPHCVQDTDGAAFHPDLQLPKHTNKITKGVRFDKDQNSAFDETGLAAHLQEHDIKRLWIGGLAMDVCVLATVLDARKEGFEVEVIADATLPVTAEGGVKAKCQMREAGAKMQTTET
jgi:nicotinamidase/pyrazinamidase